MSLSSLDAILPYTFKKLLAEAMPGAKSSHVSEVVAAGCGYRNNAAFLADLRSGGQISFVPLLHADELAMAARYAEISGIAPDVATNQIVTAVKAISSVVSGDIVPLGERSSLVDLGDGSQETAEDRAEVDADAIEKISNAIHFGKYPEAQLWEQYGRRLVVAVVHACRSIASPGTLYLSDLANTLSLDALNTMLDATAYPNMSSDARARVRTYLDSLKPFDNGGSQVFSSSSNAHDFFEEAVRLALARFRHTPPDGIDLVRSDSNPFVHASMPLGRPFTAWRKPELGLHLYAQMDRLKLGSSTEQYAFGLCKLLEQIVRHKYPDGSFSSLNLMAYARMPALIDILRDGNLSFEVRSYLNTLPDNFDRIPKGEAMEAHHRVEDALRKAVAPHNQDLFYVG